MNKQTVFFLALFSFLAAGIFPTASAEEASSFGGKISVVSVDRVFKEYKATQAKEAELQKLSESKQAEREKKVTEIRALRDELALLNDENREKQKMMIEQKLQALAEFDRQAKAAISDQRDDAISGLLKEIEEVVNSIAKEKGIDLILSDRAVLYRADTIDLTQEVITILNGRAGKSR
ncbi:MAG: OmpH family outer membrane protein [Candidatus Omnitrophota bacterium]|nr:OmpH family outer membrane protein [Candidatus Omnitrophota bacterium]